MGEGRWAWWQWGLVWLFPCYHLIWGGIVQGHYGGNLDVVPERFVWVAGVGIYGMMPWSVGMLVALLRARKPRWILGALAVCWVELIWIFGGEL